MKDQRPILIAGPTAGGKSGLAVRLAERFGGVVINADSMQVYRELRILTARPKPEEEARVPHALYGFVPGRERYSAGRFAADAARALDEARSKGLRPIIVGGTGLYFKTLIEGLSPDARDRRAGARALAGGGGEGRHGRAASHPSGRDPEMAARLAAGDTQRIVRALEVIDADRRVAGRVAAAAARAGAERGRDDPPSSSRRSAAELVRRIDARFDGDDGGGGARRGEGARRAEARQSLPVMRRWGWVRCSVISPARSILTRPRRGGQGRDPAIRQAADDLGSKAI